MALALTEKASKQVKKLLEDQNLHGVFLRLGVKGGGCSGLSYSLEFDSELGPHDKKFDVDGVQMVCDAKSYLYLNGVTLDYVTEGLQAIPRPNRAVAVEPRFRHKAGTVA